MTLWSVLELVKLFSTEEKAKKYLEDREEKRGDKYSTHDAYIKYFDVE